MTMTVVTFPMRTRKTIAPQVATAPPVTLQSGTALQNTAAPQNHQDVARENIDLIHEATRGTETLAVRGETAIEIARDLAASTRKKIKKRKRRNVIGGLGLPRETTKKDRSPTSWWGRWVKWDPCVPSDKTRSRPNPKKATP